MPVLPNTYTPPLVFQNPHLATIIPNKLRKIKGISYTRERLETPDNDFIDLDFSRKNRKSLVLILHGLEGNSDRAYAKAMVREANNKNWDACVLNQRGCSGEPNRLYSAYHSGKSDDLTLAIKWISDKHNYDEIYLVGFSLGGNIMFKYLGEQGLNLIPEIKSAVGISVPIQLESSAYELAQRKNWIYMRRFLKSLKAKTQIKILHFPDNSLTNEELMACKNFIDFDNLYTAPAHGFKNAKDYWIQCSSKQYLSSIKIPTLLVTSKDDPFLGNECYPFEEAQNSDTFNLIVTDHGGHVGFVSKLNLSTSQWIEEQTFDFLRDN